MRASPRLRVQTSVAGRGFAKRPRCVAWRHGPLHLHVPAKPRVSETTLMDADGHGRPLTPVAHRHPSLIDASRSLTPRRSISTPITSHPHLDDAISPITVGQTSAAARRIWSSNQPCPHLQSTGCRAIFVIQPLSCCGRTILTDVRAIACQAHQETSQA
jgi:hypothetical protein